MAKTLRILLAAATVLCVAVTALALERSFPTAPVKYIQAQGTDVILRAEDVRFCSDAKRAALVGNPAAVAAWSRCEDVLRRYGILPEFERVWSLAHGGGIASLLSMLLLGNVLMRDLPPVRIKRGPRLYSGRNGRARLKRASGKEIRRSGQGLAFPPGISLSRDRETRHFLISGGVGSGKTQTIRALILEAMKRGDKMLVLDTKGDMTRDLPGDIVLLAPQDARSAVWHVAADCRTRQDARELASRFIPKSNDPMWSEAAREVFVTCVVSLQAEKPGAWTWADLYARAILEPEALLELAQQYHPAASQLLKEPTSKTTMSILTTFKAHLHSIEALAEAWCETNDKLFPVSHWLDETMGTLPIVLQRDGRYPQLSTAWISGLIGLLSSYVGSPSFEESNERRVWLFLDEFPQLEQMEDFSALLDLGRSKGVCVVLTAQDTSQIRIRYGRDQTSSWTSMIGTHIVSRLNVGEGADDVSRAVGVQEIERPVRSESVSEGRRSRSLSWQPAVRPIITPSEIASRLGPTRHGVRVLMVGMGEDVYEVDIPYDSLQPVREAHVAAAWTKPGTKRQACAGRAPVATAAPPMPRLTLDDLARIRLARPEDLN